MRKFILFFLGFLMSGVVFAGSIECGMSPADDDKKITNTKRVGFSGQGAKTVSVSYDSGKDGANDFTIGSYEFDLVFGDDSVAGRLHVWDSEGRHYISSTDVPARTLPKVVEWTSLNSKYLFVTVRCTIRD